MRQSTWNDAVYMIKTAPTIEPEIMDDLISRQAAIEAVIKWFGCEPSDIGAFENIIEKLPSTQPEIIRCKDCMYWDKSWANDWGKDYHYCIMVDSVRKGDFYCADAERRIDETD